MGWIRIDRKIQSNWTWSDKPYAYGQAWIDLLLLAAYEDTKTVVNGTVVEVKRGQFFTSTRFLAERWGWSNGKVLRFFRNAERNAMLHTDSTINGTLVTIENYGLYQGERNTDGTQIDTLTDTPTDTRTERRRNADGTKNNKETNKQVNNIINIGFGGQALQDAFDDFQKMRKQTKKPMTETAVKRCITKLKRLSGEDEELAIKILNQSEDHCWSDIYPLKDEPEKSATNPSYADDNAVMKQNITDEYIHLCNAIPGCRDDNNQQLRTKYWSIIQSDNLEMAWHNAMQISEIASKEVRRVEKQERELFTLGEFLNELSSRNSSNRKSAG